MMRGALVAVIVVALLAGCTANDASIFRHFETAGTEATAVDAKQRFLITVDPDNKVEFCAEPSPDALSAISSSLSTSLSVGVFGQGEGAAGIASSLQEAAVQIGKRNATVQLFRDGWYRLCEGSLNGDVGASTYTLLATKYADSTVVWLAIEELAGLTAGSTAVSGTGGTTAGTTAGVGTAAPTQPAPAPPSGTPSTTTSKDSSSEGRTGEQTEVADANRGGAKGLLHRASLLAQTDSGAGRAPGADAANQPAESENRATTETQSEERRSNASATSDATAGAPTVSSISPTGRAANVSDTVAKAAAFMVSEYLHRARFNDCLLALDRISIDLSAGEEKDAAMDATIAGCKEVITRQATHNRMLVELLGVDGSAPEEQGDAN